MPATAISRLAVPVNEDKVQRIRLEMMMYLLKMKTRVLQCSRSFLWPARLPAIMCLLGRQRAYRLYTYLSFLFAFLSISCGKSVSGISNFAVRRCIILIIFAIISVFYIAFWLPIRASIVTSTPCWSSRIDPKQVQPEPGEGSETEEEGSAFGFIGDGEDQADGDQGEGSDAVGDVSSSSAFGFISEPDDESVSEASGSVESAAAPETVLEVHTATRMFNSIANMYFALGIASSAVKSCPNCRRFTWWFSATKKETDSRQASRIWSI